MKRWNKVLAVLLAVVMLLSIAPLSAFAQNGPMTTPVDYGSGKTYLAWITGLEPDAQGNYYRDYGVPAGTQYIFFKDMQVHNDAYPGINYDLASNTLTLNNVNAPNLVIETNVMGDDFKIKLIGTNALAHLVIWGDAYGGNLSFTGTGTLSVNENSFFDYAIEMHAEGTPGKVTFGKDVNIHLYGSWGAIQTTESSLKSAAAAFVCENGQSIDETSTEPVLRTSVEEINGIYLYEAGANCNAGWRATCKNDPDGIYTVTTGYRNDPSDVIYWVCKYVYLPQYDSYVIDSDAFKGRENEKYGELEFTAEEWEAQTEFTLWTVPSEEPAWVQFRKESDKDEEGNWTWSERQLQSAADPDGIYAYSTGQIEVGDEYIDYVEIHHFYYDSGRKIYIRDDNFASVSMHPDELDQNGWSIVKATDYVDLTYTDSYFTTWNNVYEDAQGKKYVYLWGNGAYSFKEGSGVTLSNGFNYYLTKEDSVDYADLTRCEQTEVDPDVLNIFLNSKEFHYGNGAAPHKHNYIKQKPVNPGSTSLGYTLYKCTCGDSYKSDYKAPTGKLTLKCKARTKAAQTVTWNNVKSATGYQVQISTKDAKSWDTYATLKAGVTAYTFKNLAAGNNYKFRVRFYIKGEDGKNYFSPWSATLNSPTLPSGTSISKLTAGKKCFAAQWKQNKAVTGYQVEYSTNAKFTSSKKLTVRSNKTLKSTIKSLSAKKVYYVRIRTYKTINKVNYFSTWSGATKVKTK